MAPRPVCHTLPVAVRSLFQNQTPETLLCWLQFACWDGSNLLASHSTPKSWGALSAEARMWFMGDGALCISSKSWMKPEGPSCSELCRGSWSFAICFCALLVGSARQVPLLSSPQGESATAPARGSFRLPTRDEWLPTPPAESHSLSEMGLAPLWLDSFSLSSPHLDCVSSLSLSLPWFRAFLTFWWMRWWRTRLCFRVKVRSQVWHL